MNGSDDRDERPRRSWREIDRMRDGSGHGRAEPRPTSPAARERAREATRQYVKKLDGLFADGTGGAEGERLAAAVREAHGTAELAGACRAYRNAVGLPQDPSLLSIFLDADDAELVREALGGLEMLRDAGRLELTRGLRSQLRMLAQGSDDEAAEAAEELLERL